MSRQKPALASVVISVLCQLSFPHNFWHTARQKKRKLSQDCNWNFSWTICGFNISCVCPCVTCAAQNRDSKQGRHGLGTSRRQIYILSSLRKGFATANFNVSKINDLAPTISCFSLERLSKVLVTRDTYMVKWVLKASAFGISKKPISKMGF